MPFLALGASRQQQWSPQAKDEGKPLLQGGQDARGGACSKDSGASSAPPAPPGVSAVSLVLLKAVAAPPRTPFGRLLWFACELGWRRTPPPSSSQC